jgi:hypothetical protein
MWRDRNSCSCFEKYQMEIIDQCNKKRKIGVNKQERKRNDRLTK